MLLHEEDTFTSALLPGPCIYPAGGQSNPHKEGGSFNRRDLNEIRHSSRQRYETCFNFTAWNTVADRNENEVQEVR